MNAAIPSGSRPSGRVLVLDEHDRLLLLEARDAADGHRWWVTPGGGLDTGETFEAAARRELYEETGLVASVAHWVWTRRHAFQWQGRQHDQYERFFVARVQRAEVRPVKADNYVIGHRWWSASELEQSTEEFAPRRLALLLPAILRGEYPESPIDCGV